MKKKYVQVGLGGRARFFYEAIASTYHQTCELVGFCDGIHVFTFFCPYLFTSIRFA